MFTTHTAKQSDETRAIERRAIAEAARIDERARLEERERHWAARLAGHGVTLGEVSRQMGLSDDALPRMPLCVLLAHLGYTRAVQ